MNISVIIPLYNKENRIYYTIKSVLNQTFKDFELIIVDDGSTDKSAEIVHDFCDSRIRLIQKKNGGSSSARNRGVCEARFDWIIFLDADDYMFPDSLEHFSKLVLANPNINMFVSNFFKEYNGKRQLNSFFYRNGIVTNNFRSWFFNTMMPCQGTTLYRKDILLATPYSEKLKRYEDAAMLFSLMRTQFIYTSRKPVFVYMLDNAEASKGRDNIKDDYLGHLYLSNKSWWEKIVLYDLYKQAVKLYPQQVYEVYDGNFGSNTLKVLYNVLSVVRFVFDKITWLFNCLLHVKTISSKILTR